MGRTRLTCGTACRRAREFAARKIARRQKRLAKVEISLERWEPPVAGEGTL
jgi:hypothetical protein